MNDQAKPKMTIEEARRHFEIFKMKQKAGATTIAEDTGYSQATIIATIARLAPRMTRIELYRTLCDIRQIIRSETMMHVADTLIHLGEKGVPAVIAIMQFGLQCANEDEKLDPTRAALRDRFLELIDLCIKDSQQKGPYND